jgi:hypothetical protein
VELLGVDFALVPGAAFDARCRRLGHGAGFYDRLFDEAKERPTLVAGAFEVRIVSEVPTVAHAVMMDHVITESGLYSKERSGPLYPGGGGEASARRQSGANASIRTSAGMAGLNR